MSREDDLNKYGFYRSPKSTIEEMDKIRTLAKQEFTLSSPLSLPQANMFGKELAVALLQRAGILDKEGNIVEPYR